MAEVDQLRKYVVEEKKKEFGETLTVLESLRRSRKARGGVGAPLQVPARLAGAPLIITDADLKPSKPISDGLDMAIDDANRGGNIDGEDLE